MILDKEWEVARDLIAKADERIDALRKYGFSFVASLLTADTIALRSLKDGEAKAAFGVAVGVSVVASVLVVAMRLLEKNTQLLQMAAVQRAQVIERHLGAELTEIVVERHRAQRWGWMGEVLYCVFALIVGLVGLLASGPATGIHDIWVRGAVLTGVAIISCALILAISAVESASRSRQKDDWSLDRLECAAGETIRIMLTRWGKTTEGLVEGKVVWRIDHLTERGANDVASRIATARDCENDDCKVWLWDTSGRAPGLYEVVIDPDNVRHSRGTLRRRVCVLRKPD
jgi:hypothetical protein